MHKDPRNTEFHKYCPGCKKVKSRKEFAKSSRNFGGSQGTCRDCQRDYRLKNSKKLKQKKREYTFKKKYGLTEVDRQRMYIQQNGCCMLCGKSVAYQNIHTDHNHLTGKIRRLLCCGCNIALGNFKADYGTNLLQKAVDYIKDYDKV